MKTLISSDLAATSLGGMLAGILLPLLLVAKALVKYGSLSDIDDTTSGLAYFGVIGFVGGLAVAILIGFPVLIVLKSIKWDHSLVILIASAAIGIVAPLWLLHWPSSSLLNLALLGILGGGCGAFTIFIRKKSP